MIRSCSTNNLSQWPLNCWYFSSPNNTWVICGGKSQCTSAWLHHVKHLDSGSIGSKRATCFCQRKKKEQNYTVNEGSEKNIKTQNNHATGSSLAKNPRSLGDHRNTKKNRPAMIVKLLRTYTNLKTLAELLIINTYINSKPWASTRHVQYGVVKTGTTFRYMQPIHRWSLPWQSVVLFFFWCGKKLA